MARIKSNIRIAESKARTETEAFEVESNSLSDGVFIVDITAGAGTPTLTVSIDGFDYASGKWYNIITSATLNTNATTVLRVGKNVVAAANVAVRDFLPSKFRVVATKNNATAMTYSIGVNLSD
jgi:hypothetical protein